ncbi:MAG: endonuclease V, partial [Candidatus Thermoplasmatota archaeon]|nr:endonuclease V [Candidatus Thermoplasmatota archaeon]
KKNNKFDILMVDGNGVLHPERMGLASHTGIKLEKPTIGVAKGGLCGTVKDADDPKLKEIYIDGRLAGYSFLSSKRAKRSIYVSPGHRVSFESTIELVRRMCIFKIPEPLRLAHIEAVKARKNIP